MRLSIRRVAWSFCLITLVVIVDLIHRDLRRQLQHSDGQIHPVQKRDVASPLCGGQNCKKTSNKTTLKSPSTEEPVTAIDFTIKPRNTSLKDVFISVKTTKKFHDSRVSLQVETWFRLAPQQTYFFTDGEDKKLQDQTNGHMINTNCSSTHQRAALCCKMSAEYDRYVDSNKRWFCHVDDDTYLNVHALVRLLQQYDHKGDWYLGKPSISHPLEIAHPDRPGFHVAFHFATGGAGFCLSRGLALKMMPYVGGGRLQTWCQKIRLPDDCTIGFIIAHQLKVDLTKISTFHSHLEGLWQLKQKGLSEHITFSYVDYGGKNGWNRVLIPHKYPEAEDPTRFRSIHCVLNPEEEMCKRR